MRKGDPSPLERYEAGEDVSASEMAAQAVGNLGAVIVKWALLIFLGFPVVFVLLLTVARLFS